MQIFDKNGSGSSSGSSSGRCLVFSFEFGRRWCGVASKDSSSECPILQRKRFGSPDKTSRL